MLDTLLNKWPDLVINILGVLIGGLLAYGIARWQMKRQANDKRIDDIKLLKNKFEKVCVETRDNRNKAAQLYSAICDASSGATIEEWNYFRSIGNSISFMYYQDIIRTGLNNLLPDNINNQLYSAYDSAQDLFNLIQQSANHSLALRSSAFPKVGLTLPLDNLKTHSKTVWDHLNYSVDVLYEHKNRG